MPNHIAKSTGLELAIQHLTQKLGFALAQRPRLAAKLRTLFFIETEG
jgi:hypothetical protein